jgi:signal transduction histidine kinase
MRKQILLSLYFLFFAFFANAQNALQIKDEQDYLDLNAHLQILEDSTKSWTIESVVSPQLSEKFEKSPLKSFDFGLSQSDYWARITLSASSSKEMWLEFPSLTNVVLFRFDSLTKSFVKEELGTAFTVEDKTIYIPNFIFKISLSPNPTTFYIKTFSFIAVSSPALLWQPSKFVEVHHRFTLLLGIFLGGILVAIAYNLFAWSLLKELSYLLYAITIFVNLLCQLAVHNYLILFLGDWTLQSKVALGLIFFPLSLISNVIFSAKLLHLKSSQPAIYKTFLVLAFINLLQAFCTPFAYQSRLIIYFSIFSIVFSNVLLYTLYIVAGIRSIKLLKNTGLYFTIASLLHLLGSFSVFIKVFIADTVPFFTQELIINILSAGVYIFEIILVTAALSNRVSMMKAEIAQKDFEKKLIAQEDALKLKYEKDRISKDLHDNIGSQLTYLAKNLEKLKQKPENEYLKIDNLSEMTQNIAQDLRSMIWVINKEEISVKDLEDRLANLVWKITGQIEDIEVSIRANLTKDIILNPSQALNLFRIAQEALQNAIKYSKAQSIEIQLSTNTEGNLLLQIQDDGIGFNLNEKRGEKGHYGLQNMESRAEEIGGKFKLDTAVGKGTQVQISI